VVYLRVTAFVTLGIGVILLCFPGVILHLFIPGSNEGFFIRFIGSALIGYSTLNFLASNANHIKIYKIALDANLVTLCIATILSIVGVMSGAIATYGWLLVLEHSVFTGLFAAARVVTKKL
jgi:tetrahydromethanopterin S-methyltransferase subunit C